MSKLRRFSVSVDELLLSEFDEVIAAAGYPNRSNAISDLMRERVIEDEWLGESPVAGAIVMVYDHHKSDLSGKLTDIQHDFHHLVISTQHVHLDHDNCLEIVVVKGLPVEVKTLSDKMRAAKGVKHCSLVMSTAGDHDGGESPGHTR